MRRTRLLVLALPALLGAVTAGCSHTFERNYVVPGFRADKIRRVAVLPLENHATRERAGQIISRVLATELYAHGFPVIPSQDVHRALKLDPLDPETPLSRMRVPAIGRALKADYVIVGEVGEFHYKRDLGEDPVVGFTVRMAETRTGRLVWAATHSRSEHGLFYHKHFLHENAQRVAEAMVEALTDLAGPPAAGLRSGFDTQAAPPPKKAAPPAKPKKAEGPKRAGAAERAARPPVSAPPPTAPTAPSAPPAPSPGPGSAAPRPAPSTTPAPAAPPGDGAAASSTPGSIEETAAPTSEATGTGEGGDAGGR